MAVCSAKNAALVREHGATEIVDYTDADASRAFWRSHANVFDCVYDAATSSGGGEDYLARGEFVLNKIDGSLVQLNGTPATRAAYAAGLLPSYRSMPLVSHTMNSADLESVTTLLDRARPLVTVKPFDDTGFREGFDALRSRRARGKIVFRINEDG